MVFIRSTCYGFILALGTAMLLKDLLAGTIRTMRAIRGQGYDYLADTTTKTKISALENGESTEATISRIKAELEEIQAAGGFDLVAIQ
jgi:hypothetical protein